MSPEQIQVFSIPISVMWGIQIVSLNRYRLFNTHYLYNRNVCALKNKQTIRVVAGIIFAIILPILLIWGLSATVNQLKDGMQLFIASAVMSMSLFGLTRILHAFIITGDRWRVFYDEWEFNEIAMGFHLECEYNVFYYHLAPGVCWLIFWPSMVYFYINVVLGC